MDPASSKTSARFLGLLLLGAALVLNADSLAFYIADNQHIEAPAKRQLILACQVAMGVLGLALLFGVRLPQWRAVRTVLGVAMVLAVVAGTWGTMRVKGFFTPEGERQQTEQISRMTASESVHLKLTPRFKKLGLAAMNLRLPSVGKDKIFADEVIVVDVTKKYKTKHELPTVGATFDVYEVEAGEQTIARDDLDLMGAVFDQVDHFEHVKFGFVGGDFVGEGEATPVWRVKSYFSGVGRDLHGARIQMKGNLWVRWDLDGDASNREHLNDADLWHIAEFRFTDFKTTATPYQLFAEELDRAIPDLDAREAARANPNRDLLVDWLTKDAMGEEWQKPHEHWDYRGAWVLPSVSVVDLDGDGYDDFYSMTQMGRNQFFHNQQDGTFEERAEELGIDVEDYSNTALFADFDNDGDPDLFLGRSLEASIYFENDGTRFEEAPHQFQDGLVYFAATASAADYDRDGLLDLYVGTYGAQATIKDLNRRHRLGGKLLGEYLPENQARELHRLAVEGMEHHIHDRFGPPNALMHNAGVSGFEYVEDTPLTLYRNTFQATWADVDEDGDPDIYAANDFALNNMFRNEGGQFVDVTTEMNAGDVGFGMGASWGDYDRDGDQDLYVSNMYSKAGNRILPRVSGLDPRFLSMAAGNSLLRYDGDRFTRVSTKDDTGMKVEVGGWSWGSQFLDADNDGWLDLYTLNGYYSAPAFFRNDVDL